MTSRPPRGQQADTKRHLALSQVGPGTLERHPQDGWTLAHPYPLGPRALTENVVQLAPLGGRLTPTALAQRWHRFALAHRLPREDRDVLKRCTIRAEFPLKSEKRVTAR